MEYQEILKIIFECLGALATGALLTIIPKLKAWLETKVGEKQASNIYELIEVFVESAEQQYKSEDKEGTIRKQYVMDRLREVGIEITNEINAYIESAVFNLPHTK